MKAKTATSCAAAFALGVTVFGATLVTSVPEAQASPGYYDGYYMKKQGNKTHCMYIANRAITDPDSQPAISYQVVGPIGSGIYRGGFSRKWTNWTGAPGDPDFQKAGHLSRFVGRLGEGKNVRGPKTKVKIEQWQNGPSYWESTKGGIKVRTKVGKSPRLEWVDSNRFHRYCPWD